MEMAKRKNNTDQIKGKNQNTEYKYMLESFIKVLTTDVTFEVNDSLKLNKPHRFYYL